jgi:predicted phosphodiesterase
MCIAIVSDIHGNRTAFEAVLADPRLRSPDLILLGGDLADNGTTGSGANILRPEFAGELFGEGRLWP